MKRQITDEVLVKRASHAGRNLSVLAILASLLALLYMVLAIIGALNSSFFLFALVVPAVLMAAGYWCLAVAAKRGDPSAVGVVIVVMGGMVFLNLIFGGIAAARGGEPTNMAGLLVALVVIIALSSSRTVILELKKRGLWAQVFEGAKPTGIPRVAGGVMLVLGLLGLLGVGVVSGFNAASSSHAEGERAQAFVRMLEQEEAVLLEDIARWSGSGEVQHLLQAVRSGNRLHDRVSELKIGANNRSEIADILDTYERGVNQWLEALNLLNAGDPLEGKPQELFVSGDRLRLIALETFDRIYGG